MSPSDLLATPVSECLSDRCKCLYIITERHMKTLNKLTSSTSCKTCLTGMRYDSGNNASFEMISESSVPRQFQTPTCPNQAWPPFKLAIEPNHTAQISAVQGQWGVNLELESYSLLSRASSNSWKRTLSPFPSQAYPSFTEQRYAWNLKFPSGTYTLKGAKAAVPVLGCNWRVGETVLTPPVASSITLADVPFIKGTSMLIGCDIGASPARATE